MALTLFPLTPIPLSLLSVGMFGNIYKMLHDGLVFFFLQDWSAAQIPPPSAPRESRKLQNCLGL